VFGLDRKGVEWRRCRGLYYKVFAVNLWHDLCLFSTWLELSNIHVNISSSLPRPSNLHQLTSSPTHIFTNSHLHQLTAVHSISEKMVKPFPREQGQFGFIEQKRASPEIMVYTGYSTVPDEVEQMLFEVK